MRDKMVFHDGELWLGDCLALMAEIPAGSIDMILCDLPYGTTQNKWDAIIPLEPLWREYRRICRGAIVLTAAQPFTSVLVSSAIDIFRYDWVWEKQPSGNLNAKRRPMPAHEHVLVFGAGPYYPQGLRPTLRKRTAADNSRTENYGAQKRTAYEQTVTGYPVSIIGFPKEKNFHPTAKPAALFDYLIRTYTEPGQLVLDNCSGSGTTAVAARGCDRRWLCIERDPGYYWQSVARVAST